MFDIVVVGAGMSGSLIANLCAKRGLSVAIIEKFQAIPNEFRAEQIVGEQLNLLREAGVLDSIIAEIPEIKLASNYLQGRRLSNAHASHYGLPYCEMIHRIRAQIPANVTQIYGCVKSIEAGCVTIDNQRITGSLIVVASGLNTSLTRPFRLNYRRYPELHSLSIGFDLIAPVLANAISVHYPPNLSDRIDYLSIFPCGSGLRGNLFVFQDDPTNPWVKAFRKQPLAVLLRVFPHLSEHFGQFSIANVQIRPSPIAVLEDPARDGVVWIGDVFQTPCPAAGTGYGRLIRDALQLSQHAPRWLAAGDVSAKAIQSFYDDPLKRRADRSALCQTYDRMNIATNDSLYWHALRQLIDEKRKVKAGLHHARKLTQYRPPMNVPLPKPPPVAEA
jgi:2-polyprenyl-6-methoxyphenol hydroxylase-like FAD-dependent oxidoreductase